MTELLGTAVTDEVGFSHWVQHPYGTDQQTARAGGMVQLGYVLRSISDLK